MGSGRFDHHSWNSYATAQSYATKTTDEIFSQRGVAQELNPKGVSVRESRDSTDNPQSTPLIVGLDVTGSMSMVLDQLARVGLPKLMKEVYDRAPIRDPHVMAMGIGDLDCDGAPLQVTQFEADIRIAKQLERIYLERGGGGNDHESYTLPWYFAAYHTAIDSFEKRGEKGYLFTTGDEMPPAELPRRKLRDLLGGQIPADRDLTTAGLLAAASARWHVYHVIVAEGSYARDHETAVRAAWTELLGERAIFLRNHKMLAETIVSVLQIAGGQDASAVAGSWGAVAPSVAEAVGHLRAIDLGGGLGA